MTNEERDNLLLKMDEKLSKHDERFQRIEEKLSQHDLLFKEIHEDLTSIHANIGSIDSRLDRLEKGQRKMQGTLEDHGDKIKLLLELVGKRTQTITEVNEALDFHDKKLYEHDIRIRVLESKAEEAKVGNL